MEQQPLVHKVISVASISGQEFSIVNDKPVSKLNETKKNV